MKKYLCAFLLLFLSAGTQAYSPAPGLWWNTNESGRGYTIDVQDGVMIVTAYVYTQSGAATWFLASGNYNNSTNTFTSQVGAFSGGQCWGCSYHNPSGVAAGTLTIKFSSPETGVMTYPGGTTQIQHQVYAYGSKTDYLLGEWSFNTDIGSGLYDTQWVVFNGHYTGSDGTVYASGQEDGVSGTVALGAYSSSGNGFVVIVQDDVGYDHEYIFPLADDRRMLGLGTLFKSTASPPTPNDVASGSRLLFASELSSTTKALRAPMPLAYDDARLEHLAQSVQALAWQHGIQ